MKKESRAFSPMPPDIKRARAGIALSLVCVLAFFACRAPALGAVGETAVLMRDAGVYREPSTDSPLLGQLKVGAVLTACSVHDGWIEVEYLLRRGYVERGALSVSAAETDAAIGVTLIGRTLYVARRATLERASGLEPLELPAGEKVTLLGVNDHRADVLWGARAGSMPLSALAVDEELCYILGAPGDSIAELQTRLETLGFFDAAPSGTFDVPTAEAVIRFRIQSGLPDAFAMDEDTQERLFASDAPHSFILVAMLSPGDTGNSVRRLQERLRAKGYLETEVLGHYDSLTSQAVMLYQSMERIPETGVADPDTLGRLFSSDARALPRNLIPATAETARYLPGGVLNVDWFEGDVSEVFEKGAVARITDIVSGLSWHEMRRGGYNHADVQPLTAEDTATFLAAIGGEWTWERRPIWVTVGGLRYAASMNCMPHGEGAIETNNYPGHHCVHFLNSRTHATNHLDERHQMCVSVAASKDIAAALEEWYVFLEDLAAASEED